MKYILALVLSLFISSTSANNLADIKDGSTEMTKNNQINYIEIPAKNIEATKTFFSDVFGWSFVDYGPDYSSFAAQGVDGGFFKSDLVVSTKNGSPLIVLYSNLLETTQDNIEKAGGKIVKPIFSFPGGRRFHFSDPNGNEFAVWSE
ncbi:Glyoxalase/bleomycin resistance protein/dioxygenase [Shewanella violacea]